MAGKRRVAVTVIGSTVHVWPRALPPDDWGHSYRLRYFCPGAATPKPPGRPTATAAQRTPGTDPGATLPFVEERYESELTRPPPSSTVSTGRWSA